MSINVPFLHPSAIDRKVKEFCQLYPQACESPVDIENLIEFDLGIAIRPVNGLRHLADVDAFLSRDRTQIVVDHDHFVTDRFQNRMRFSLAHEVGHYVLHEDVYGEIADFKSEEEWMEFITQKLPQTEYSKLEFQAHEFAGRLLVPTDRLRTSYDACLEKATRGGIVITASNISTVINRLAPVLSREYQVSEDVIMRRLKKEGIWAGEEA